MKRYLGFILVAFVLFTTFKVNAQDTDSLVDSLTTIDENIRGYFPRWKVCETDLQIQIHQAFTLYGFDKDKLNMQQIEILAAPRSIDEEYSEILTISCGEAYLNSVEIEAYIPDKLVDILTGRREYLGRTPSGKDYCFIEIPVEIPVTSSQAQAIVSYLEPTNVTHAITISLFEQSLKIGNSGFWLLNKIGNDQIGYHFWEAGEAKAMLKRPLYANKDPKTRGKIPYLINLYVGAGYRIASGINDESSALNWITDRHLNSGPGGKLVAGLDINMPFKPEAGLHINLELPMKSIQDEGIDKYKYCMQTPGENVEFTPNNPRNGQYNIYGVAPLLRSTGQVTLFYNWWLDEKNPENYLRFDLGLGYAEVKEMAVFDSTDALNPTYIHSTVITADGVNGLKTYKPDEFGDWLYFKAEYRNQATWPFGASIQYSNQMFLGRIYFPLLGNWLYIEAKYSTPLRGVRPYEIKNFFMVSPVIRLTI